MSDARTRALQRRLAPGDTTIARTALEFLDARRNSKTVSFIEDAMITEVDRAMAELDYPEEELGPVIVISDQPVHVAVGWLYRRPWLSHVVNTDMLAHPALPDHLGHVAATLTKGGRPRLLDWLGAEFHARRVRLARASKRADRLDRMAEHFESQGISSRTVEFLRDGAEELLTNAFYDAPVAAGVFKHAISRTKDVSLSDAGACDLVYGSCGDLAVVRVKDPFGSLTRDRLVEVLRRCARTDGKVEIDERMGGAGLGLWRMFSRASFVALSVVRDRHTEFLLGFGKRTAKGPRPFAFHLFFKERSGDTVKRWRLVDVDTGPIGLDGSVTIVTK